MMVWLWLGSSALIWGLLLLGLTQWGRGFTLPSSLEDNGSSVRVCIPARDEELNISACVQGALGSTWGELEVVVVDDHSSDRTVECARAAAGGDGRFTLVYAPEKPPEWAGKSWAVQTGAELSSSDWLLFVDADVVLSPSALASAVHTAEVEGLDMLSLFGTWELLGFWEQLVIPTVGWFIRGASQPERVNAGEAAFANGQFILIRAKTWRSFGGHHAVRSAVLDDVELAKAAHKSGARLGLYWAPWAFRVRLYRSLREIVLGYQKNLYAGAGERPALIGLAVAFIAMTTVFPPIGALLFWTLGFTRWALAAGVVSVLACVYRLSLERLDGRSGWVAPFHSLGALVLIVILLRSVLSKTVSWKGRTFDGGNARE